MESPNILTQDKKYEGFTLIEILIAVGILAIILSFGLILSMDFYKTYAFNYEKDLIVGLLQKARSQSMANIYESNYGITFNSIDHQYILIKGLSVDQVFEANKSIDITWPEDVVFNQLEGKCQTCDSSDIEIILSGLGKTGTITINNEGRINY